MKENLLLICTKNGELTQKKIMLYLAYLCNSFLAVSLKVALSP